MSSRPRATRRSPAAASSMPVNVRTEWSSFVPESQSGYQTCSAPDPELDVVVRDEHDVEVGVRRQLGPPVPADRDQRGPGVGQRGAGVRLHAPLVGGGGALSSSLSGHVCAVIASPRGL